LLAKESRQKTLLKEVNNLLSQKGLNKDEWNCFKWL
jgi:hypothetical protein